MKNLLNLVPTTLIFISYLPTYFLIHTKKTHFNIASFLLWILIDSTVILTTYFSGGQIPFISYGFVGADILVVGLIINSKHWKWHQKENITLGLVILSLLIWYFTNAFNGLIFITIVKYFIAGAPTIIDSYKHPQKTQIFYWGMISLAAFINILIVENKILQSYFFLIFAFVFNFFVAILNTRKIKI